MKKLIFSVAVLCFCALCAYLLWGGYFTYFWAFIAFSIVCLFIVVPLLKQGWPSYLYTQYTGNPILRRIISRAISWKENKLSKDWLSRVEYVRQEDIPAIHWVEDAQRSKGLDSFYCLDQYSEDCRQILHRSYHLMRDDRLWFVSKFTNEYYFDPEYSSQPRYDMKREGENLSVITGSRLDTWIYLVSKQKCPAVYAMEFDYMPHIEMQETLQIDFCCHSLSRRFRFNLENNRTLKFDVTDKGCFVYWNNTKGWDKFKKPCSLPLDKYTHVRLEVINDVFAIYYDHVLQMAVKMKDYQPCLTDWYLVFWNGVEEEQLLSMELKNFHLYIPAEA